MMENLIPQDSLSFLDQILADGAYYDHKRAEVFIKKEIIPTIPPSKTAVVQGKKSTLA